MSEREPERPSMVENWGVERGVGLLVNGKVFPYWVAAEGPMVEAIEGIADRHILWLPLIAEGPAPRAGRPNAEPATLPPDHDGDCDDRWDHLGRWLEGGGR